ncbi:hypothetical protein LTR37_019097 [Vermiconidia calcicola]|uniref:Uncharacterized protein n=1 Tax=Vermiconidia calcicola TaxID=1690605 RepID=A0ACC3MF88_9PEZI|nr:hypothetical protein LTR37_019097 [Vermiconidia calcicola]
MSSADVSICGWSSEIEVRFRDLGNSQDASGAAENLQLFHLAKLQDCIHLHTVLATSTHSEMRVTAGQVTTPDEHITARETDNAQPVLSSSGTHGMEMTPIRVRGKRKGTRAEKWNYGKQRKVSRSSSHTPTEQSSGSHAISPSTRSSSRRRRKRHDRELSRLEQLPTEVLQTIFELSANVDLPLASPQLALQLGSRHLYHQLTTKVLHSVLRSSVLRSSDVTSSDLSAAMRLMNSKFFTWSFFQSWLLEEFRRFELQGVWEEKVSNAIGENRHTNCAWRMLQPHDDLLPPRKLLRSPFTADKVEFLAFLLSSRLEPYRLDPFYTELAKEGLHQAVSQGAGNHLSLFWDLGIQPDTELLRQAVIDTGCDKSTVRKLVTRAAGLPEQNDVDFLDPALWSWAEKARTAGDERGPWLMELLRDSARASRCNERVIEQVNFDATM